MDIAAAVLSISLIGNHAAPEGCNLAGIDSAREVNDTLSLRAVEIVAKASSDAWANDPTLADLISPSATFSLGAGDVGRPLATGLDGARALAILVDATSYRFYGWNYMNMPADACVPQKVNVEFVGRDGRTSSTIEFTFDRARLVSASGWQRGFESGPLP